MNVIQQVIKFIHKYFKKENKSVRIVNNKN